MATGALSVTCDAISGGASASLTFENSSKFLKSHANYSINVKVTNQKLIADDVTEFTPIPNIPATKFNEVYGDCFISGFIEGGVLNALVMKEVVDDEENTKLAGKIAIAASVAGGAVQVSGSAEGEKKDGSKKTSIKTTIECVPSVSISTAVANFHAVFRGPVVATSSLTAWRNGTSRH